MDEMAGTDAEGFGDLNQEINGDGFLAAFQFTNVIVVKVGFLRQPLMTHARVFTARADGFTQDFAMFRYGRHAHERKQERAKPTTV